MCTSSLDIHATENGMPEIYRSAQGLHVTKNKNQGYGVLNLVYMLQRTGHQKCRSVLVVNTSEKDIFIKTVFHIQKWAGGSLQEVFTLQRGSAEDVQVCIRVNRNAKLRDGHICQHEEHLLRTK